MNTLRTSEQRCETSRWSARPSASQFSETLRKRPRVLKVSVLIAFTLGGCGYAGTPPPPGQYLGYRPDGSIPDGPLADDDRTGIRAQYPDPNDTLNVGAIRGRIVPANPFALAAFAAPSPGVLVTGMVGAHVVAVDADTGSVIAGTLGGWSCDAANPPTQFDGSSDLERLPVGRSYNLYAEPLVGLALPGDYSNVFTGLCSSTVAPACAAPQVNINFNVRVLPAVP